jgi:nitroreductase
MHVDTVAQCTYSADVPIELSCTELLTTTRSVRKRLDFERPVERAVVEDCLRVAFQAPNGSNQQTWNWVLVDDADTRRQMADIYRGGLADHLATPDRPGARTAAPADQAAVEAIGRMSASVMYLIEHMQDAPVLLVPTTAGRLEGSNVFHQASVWGSILPAVWNLMLGLRLQGLGSAWTTLSLYREREMAELLGIPFDTNTQAGLFPIAYTIGTDFRTADRSRSEAAIRWNHW